MLSISKEHPRTTLTFLLVAAIGLIGYVWYVVETGIQERYRRTII
jgi:hypothetical protein